MTRVLSTLAKATERRVTWRGDDIARHPDPLRRELGYLPQGFGVYEALSAREFLAFLAAVKGLPARTVAAHGEVLDIAEQARAAMLAAGRDESHYSSTDTRGGANMYNRKGDRSATLAMAWGGDGQVRMMYNFATVPR
jgi:ABC-type multidrug transport system ATPase subunit